MRNVYLLVILLLFHPGFSFAQNFSGGVVIGMNMSQIDGDNIHGFDKRGWALGGYVNYRFSEMISLQPELLFEQIGSRSAGRTLNSVSNPNMDVIINTLNLPLYLMISYPVSFGVTDMTIDWYAGGSLGVNLSWEDFNENHSHINQLKRYDVRATAGMNVPVGNVMSFNARLSYSLAPSLDTRIPPPPGTAFNDMETVRVRWYYRYITFSVRFNIYQPDRWR